ncbi:Na+/dicarboxylate symporter [Paraglaciecola psychrophila 170]|uniref:Na+/dicarboxylate symporter n=1 Tax=Paraglaciecola psychrophila 170 TaxID=1129794 RepID=M4RSN1_9ALTE|nr:Na+/dicarboxylate symporter [Paraglaciecola psychrophila 170]
MQTNNKLILISAMSATVLYFGLVAVGQPHLIASTASITLFTAMLWVTEALPIPVTSLIPFSVFLWRGY